MNPLNDLDGPSWLAAVATLALCGLVLGVSLWNRRSDGAVELGGIPKLLGPLGVLCLIGAANSYSRYGAVPRKTVEGSIHIVHVTRGRSFTEYICADTCQASGGYALALDAMATRATERYPAATRFRFTYPNQPRGGALTGVSLVVESIAEADSGTVIYRQDLLNHPLRITFYLADLILAILSAYVFLRPANRSGPTDGESEDAFAEPSRSEGESASLHLE